MYSLQSTKYSLHSTNFKKIKTTINISLWILSLLAIMAMLGFVEGKIDTELCKAINVKISRPSGNFFVEEEDVVQLIKNRGHAMVGMEMADINISEIEKLLNNNPSIEKTEVFVTIDGELNVELTQRKPLIRIFNKKGDSFYIDKNGWLMPLSSSYTAKVLIANGEIEETYATSYKTNINDIENEENMLKQLYVLAQKLHQNKFWNAQISQVYVDNMQDILLIPRVGNHTIVIGDVSQLDEKLKKLMIFYKKGLKRTGWNNYKTINLKFNNQVVCTKK